MASKMAAKGLVRTSGTETLAPRAGMMDCKKALAQCEGDMAKASDFLRAKGLAKAGSKSGRVAAEGVIASYIHAGNRQASEYACCPVHTPDASQPSCTQAWSQALAELASACSRTSRLHTVASIAEQTRACLLLQPGW